MIRTPDLLVFGQKVGHRRIGLIDTHKSS